MNRVLRITEPASERRKPQLSIYDTAEGARLVLIKEKRAHWNRWGPFLSERAWGTVREDYSPDGQAWSYLPHDHASTSPPDGSQLVRLRGHPSGVSDGHLAFHCNSWLCLGNRPLDLGCRSDSRRKRLSSKRQQNFAQWQRPRSRLSTLVHRRLLFELPQNSKPELRASETLGDVS